jgi:hypothetical protein
LAQQSHRRIAAVYCCRLIYAGEIESWYRYSLTVRPLNRVAKMLLSVRVEHEIELSKL